MHTYIHRKIRLGSPAYIGLCLDVGPSMAEQVGDLGVTLIGGYGQGGEPILSETKRERDIQHTMRSGQVILH